MQKLNLENMESSKEKKDKIVLLPIKTYHQIRTPLVSLLGKNFKIEVIIDKDVIDFRNSDWQEQIHNFVSSKFKELKTSDIYLCPVGPPPLSLYLFYVLIKNGINVKILAWDPSRKKYEVIECLS